MTLQDAEKLEVSKEVIKSGQLGEEKTCGQKQFLGLTPGARIPKGVCGENSSAILGWRKDVQKSYFPYLV